MRISEVLSEMPGMLPETLGTISEMLPGWVPEWVCGMRWAPTVMRSVWVPKWELLSVLPLHPDVLPSETLAFCPEP